MSLAKVISKLTRAQYGEAGNSIPAGLEGAELDKYVADLLVADARIDKASGVYSQADNEPDSKAKIANKRFLNNVIRDVSFHNRALLQAERHLQSNKPGPSTRERSQDRRRDPDDRYREKRAERRSSPERFSSSSSRYVDDDISISRRREYKHPIEPRITDSANLTPGSRVREDPKIRPSCNPPPPSASPPPLPIEPLPIRSKMDRYFDPGYSPSNDHALLRHQKQGALPDLPKLGGGNGLISDLEFDAWSTMLSVLEKRKLKESNVYPESSTHQTKASDRELVKESERKEKKAERKRQKAARAVDEIESLEDRSRRKKKSKEKNTSNSFGFGTAGTSLTKSQDADFYWATKGGEREWDMGKSNDLSF